MDSSSPATLTTPPSLECREVSRRLASGDALLTVLDRVSLTIMPREFVAVMGASGSGKSTLLGLLAGFDRPSSGSVRVEGRALEGLGEDDLSRMRRASMGFVFQDFQLLDHLTARENVLLPLELARAPDAAARCDVQLAQVGLHDRAHHYPAQLSGGEQQRVALARAFAPRPRILLADEPTGNLDAVNGAAVLDLLVTLRELHGATLVVVTHDEQVARRADRVVRLAAGRCVAGPAQ